MAQATGKTKAVYGPTIDSSSEIAPPSGGGSPQQSLRVVTMANDRFPISGIGGGMTGIRIPTSGGGTFGVGLGSGAVGGRGPIGGGSFSVRFKKGGAVKPVWEKDRPEGLGKPKSLSVKKKAAAKAKAKSAGRPYPNMVDNIAAARKKGK